MPARVLPTRKLIAKIIPIAATTLETFALRINRQTVSRISGWYSMLCAEYIVWIQSAFRKSIASLHRANEKQIQLSDSKGTDCRWKFHLKLYLTYKVVLTKALVGTILFFCSMPLRSAIISAETYKSWTAAVQWPAFSLQQPTRCSSLLLVQALKPKALH